VGWAFEVINTTAELWKQGTVTTYRMPQVDDDVVTFSGSALNTHSLAKQRELPPANPSSALVLPGSKQWDAARGSYCVMSLASLDNPLECVSNRPRFLMANNVAKTSVTSTTAALKTGDILTASPATFSCFLNAPYNTSGSYFTGLSLQTTLTLTMKLLIESAPGPTSPFVTLSHPSPTYDPEAIRLYSQLTNHLPVAVPFDENPSGEWFGEVLGTLGALSSMASGINPLFGVLGAGLQVAKSVAPKIASLFNEVKQLKKKEKKEHTSQSNQPRSLGSGKTPTKKVNKTPLAKGKMASASPGRKSR
jgi:hypothetical protein